MASKREKLGLISLGIFMGIVIAASVMWWQKSLYQSDWFSFARVKSYLHGILDRKGDVFTQVEERKHAGQSGKTKKQNLSASADSMDAVLDSLLLNDSLGQMAYINEYGLDYYIDTEGLPDSILNQSPRKKGGLRAMDTLIHDSLTWKQNTRENANIVIKRDEFLQSKSFRVKGLQDTLLTNTYRLDSLLTHDHYTSRVPSNVYKIEFWRSPVNYTGYRMTSNRIVLFGNFDPELISLEYANRKLLLRYKNNVFQLEFSAGFLPLVPVKKS